MPTMIKDPSKLTGQLKKRTARYREVHDQAASPDAPRPKMYFGRLTEPWSDLESLKSPPISTERRQPCTISFGAVSDSEQPEH